MTVTGNLPVFLTEYFSKSQETVFLLPGMWKCGRASCTDSVRFIAFCFPTLDQSYHQFICHVKSWFLSWMCKDARRPSPRTHGPCHWGVLWAPTVVITFLTCALALYTGTKSEHFILSLLFLCVIAAGSTCLKFDWTVCNSLCKFVLHNSSEKHMSPPVTVNQSQNSQGALCGVKDHSLLFLWQHVLRNYTLFISMCFLHHYY